MVVYGEYLFLENFIIGGAVIFFGGKIAGEKILWWRVIACSVLSGLFSFLLFFRINNALLAMLKIGFVIILALTGFGFRSVKRTVINGFIVLGITFLYGGIAIAIIIAMGYEGVTGIEGLYLPQITYVTVTSAGMAASLIVWLLCDMLRCRKQDIKAEVPVWVGFGGHEWSLRGYIDTGNFLRDPIEKRPVCIVSEKTLMEMLKAIDFADSRYVAVPYRDIGTKKGILNGYRCEYIRTPEKELDSPILACTKDGIRLGDSKDWILLHRDMLERGITEGVAET